MVKLNILTGKGGERADQYIEVSEEKFWENYLRLMDVRPTGNRLSEKEIQVMTLILSGNPDKSYFRGKERQELLSKLRIQSPDLSKMKDLLIFKQFIESTGEVRGDALPTLNIRKFQKYVKNAIAKGTVMPINFNASFLIKEEDTLTDTGDKPQE